MSYSQITIAKNCTIRSLSASDSEGLSQKLHAIKLDPYECFKQSSTTAGFVLNQKFNPGLLKEIHNVRNHKLDCLIIKGLPISFDILKDTPISDSVPQGKDFVSEMVLLGLSKILNTRPYLNIEEKDGSIIQQVIPLANRENTASGGGFKKAFHSHTENVHEESPPDLFMLICLRGNEHAQTTFISIEQLMAGLPTWVREGMKKRDFIFRTGPSYSKTFKRRGSILDLNESNQWEIRYNANPGRIEPCNYQAQKVMAFLDTFLQDKRNLNFICLEKGDCIILNNKRALHGRTTFKDDVYSPQKRWLQRIYLHRK